MRKLWRKMPRLAKVGGILALGLILMGAAYLILTITGTITVQEAITVDEPLTFNITMYPNETVVKTFTVRNAGSEDIDVKLNIILTPSETGLTAETSPDDNLIVPGNGSAQFTLTLSAKSDVIPQGYTVTVDVKR